MKEQKLEIYLFFILLGTALFLSFKVLSPYLYTLIVAVIFAVLFSPLHLFFKKMFRSHESLSALATVLVVVCMVLVPLAFFGIQLSDEVRQMYDWSVKSVEGGGVIERVTDTANNLIISASPFQITEPVISVEDTKNYALQALSWIRGNFGSIFSGVANFFVNILIFLISFYFLVRDGAKFKKMLVQISPFRDERDEVILSKLHLAINSIAKGSILVALIQGFLSMIGFSIFGVPSPVLWGGVATVAALIPGLGTSLVLIPVILYLFFVGATTQAVGLLIWGALAVGFIDNLLGPKLVGEGIKIHPLLVLLSALGGISFFGVIGFILGPITISFLFTLLHIYQTIIIKNRI